MKKYKFSKKSILKDIIVRTIIFEIIMFVIMKSNFQLDKKIIFKSISIDIGNFISLYKITVIVYIIVAIILPIINYLFKSYIINSKAIEIKKGIIYKNNVFISIDKIKYIKVTNDPLDMILGIQTVYLYTAGGKRKLKGLSVENVKDIWNIIKNKI